MVEKSINEMISQQSGCGGGAVRRRVIETAGKGASYLSDVGARAQSHSRTPHPPRVHVHVLSALARAL